MQRIAVFLLLILAFFTQALAESATDDAYAKNILFSDIHVQPASPSGRGELFVTGKVTNNGGKNVTGLKVSLVVGRRGMTVSRDFFIVQNGSTGVPLDARRALEAHDSRSFSATLAGFSRTQGARIEIESLFTEEAQSREPQQRADSGSAAWLLLGFVIAVGAALIIFYILPSQRQARLRRAQEDAAQAQQAAEREKRLEEAAQKLVDIYTSASQQQLPLLNDQVSGVILQRGEACYLCEQSVGHVVLKNRTHYVGTSHGVSFRIMRGVSYRVGAYRGQPITETHAVLADVGTLYVTNQRVIFAGQTEITSVPVKKVADVRVAASDLIVLSENRKTPFILRTPSKYGSVVAAAAIRRVADDATGARLSSPRSKAPEENKALPR